MVDKSVWDSKKFRTAPIQAGVALLQKVGFTLSEKIARLISVYIAGQDLANKSKHAG